MPRQSSQTRKSTDKDKASVERKKRSSSTGKVPSNETKHTDGKAGRTTKIAKKTNEKKKENSKNIEAIDIPPAEVKMKSNHLQSK